MNDKLFTIKTTIKQNNKQKPMSRWDITGSKKMIKTLIMLLVCMTSFHTVSPNSIKDEENKGDVNQTRTISADFGWEKNIRIRYLKLCGLCELCVRLLTQFGKLYTET